MATYVAAEMTAVSSASTLIFGIDPLWPAVIIGLGALIDTTYRGFLGTVYTDNPENIVIMLIVVAIFGWGISNVVGAGGINEIAAKVSAQSPSAFDFSNIDGLEFAITLILGIVGAEILNQSNWQRVFAARDNGSMMRAAGLSALMVVPVMLMVGSFGFFALATGPVENPSVAMFAYMQNSAPQWVLYAVLVLVVALVMGTIATLVNGMVSLFAVEMVRVRPAMEKKSVLTLSRAIAFVLSAAAIWIATLGYSVLYIFLVADLVCLACAFPVFYGMFSRRCSGRSALIASVAGIAAGAAYFPNPDFAGGNMFYAFVAALAVPTLAVVALSRLLDRGAFDFAILKERVRGLE
jgi:Na+/proline symporter